MSIVVRFGMFSVVTFNSWTVMLSGCIEYASRLRSSCLLVMPLKLIHRMRMSMTVLFDLFLIVVACVSA